MKKKLTIVRDHLCACEPVETARRKTSMLRNDRSVKAFLKWVAKRGVVLARYYEESGLSAQRVNLDELLEEYEAFKRRETMAMGADLMFSFCESVAATGISPWHIRKLTKVGKKLGGGIDTSSLCGRVSRGWDLEVEITEHHLSHSCEECVRRYREATK